MLFGESFEEPSGPTGISGSNVTGPTERKQKTAATWSAYGSAGSYAVSTDAYNGAQSQQLGGAGAGVVNYGLGLQGMALQSGHEYVGHLYAKHVQCVENEAALLIHLVDDSNTVATQRIPITAGQWQKYNFSLVPTAKTACASTTQPRVPCVNTPEMGSNCIQCTGDFPHVRSISVFTCDG